MSKRINFEDVKQVLSLLGLNLDEHKVTDSHYMIGDFDDDSHIITDILNIHGYYGQVVEIFFEEGFLKNIEISSIP